ncbi:MAG: acyl-CoA thioesterase [Cellvibrionaceae bacterium]
MKPNENALSKDTPFTVLIRVRYAECDAQRVVFNSRYGDYVDIALTEYMRKLFGGYEELLKKGIDNQVVKLSTEWTSSAKSDDVLALTVRTSHIGNTSFSFQLELTNHKTKKEIAVTDIIYVLVDSTNYQKMSIPTEMRKTLEIGASNVVIDFSGGF